MSHSHLIANAPDARTFMTAGNATVTLVSRRTGARFTYRVRRSDDGMCHFVKVLTGADNETAYSYVGYVRRGVFFHGGNRARVSRDAPSYIAFDYAWRALAQDAMPSQLEVWHEGRCGRCGRKLTVPSSIASGLGPECAGRIAA